MTVLREYQSRPATSKRDLAYLTVTDMARSVKQYQQSMQHSFSCPKHEALEFYLLNHIMSDLSLKVGNDTALSDAEKGLANTYYTSLNRFSMRAFAYLWCITTREARHIGSRPDDVIDSMEGGQGYWMLVKKIRGMDGCEAAEAAMELASSKEIGGYVHFLYRIFSECHWKSGYGGKAWAAVVDVLRRFICSEFTAEMMVDTVYTLAHNNGPIFNKGIFYQNPDKHELLQVLDVQRSGQIPSLIREAYSPTNLSTLLDEAEVALGMTYHTHVNWKQVKELGGVGNYDSKIAAQPEDLDEHGTKYHVTAPGVTVKIQERDHEESE